MKRIKMRKSATMIENAIVALILVATIMLGAVVTGNRPEPVEDTALPASKSN